MHVRRVRLLSPEDAYRLWSESYDAQPGNVVLALEQQIFDEQISDVPIEGNAIVDVGCGTGRHWAEILSRNPGSLRGVDSSPEMLARLRGRYPEAIVYRRSGRSMGEFPDGSVDVIVSTLMLAHVREVDDELQEWARMLAPRGRIVMTDFHPAATRAGAKRTFRHHGAAFEVESHPHSIEALRSRFDALGLEVLGFHERTYSRGDTDGEASRVPVVFGFHLRRAK